MSLNLKKTTPNLLKGKDEKPFKLHQYVRDAVPLPDKAVKKNMQDEVFWSFSDSKELCGKVYRIKEWYLEVLVWHLYELVNANLRVERRFMDVYGRNITCELQPNIRRIRSDKLHQHSTAIVTPITITGLSSAVVSLQMRGYPDRVTCSVTETSVTCKKYPGIYREVLWVSMSLSLFRNRIILQFGFR
ncbi:hypothetical protein DAPPUDRAFT_314670 [Daphnia pulex]|uniref:Uncharacterized protein n=1 Tax=Daphnia pulex TaxID=6669 RepID=E9G733_DAPPU|nr:hypothetical protein DAPPUDRAFT_314670 [Daphnia pulex]|eukprot:EFX84397.1 hypothetical protein DAPPUDRAFT_314670 [Daphnia pulex]